MRPRTLALRMLAIGGILGGIAMIVARPETPMLRTLGTVTSVLGGVLLILVAIQEAHHGHQHHEMSTAQAVRYGRFLEKRELERTNDDRHGDDLV